MQGIRIFKFFVRISSVHNDLAEKCVDLFQLYYILTRLRLWSIIFVNTKLVVMSLSWKFLAQAELSYEGSELSRAGALQFSS